MTYKVIDIEGVGEVYAEKLIAAGIKTDAADVKADGTINIADVTALVDMLLNGTND